MADPELSPKELADIEHIVATQAEPGKEDILRKTLSDIALARHRRSQAHQTPTPTDDLPTGLKLEEHNRTAASGHTVRHPQVLVIRGDHVNPRESDRSATGKPR